MVEIIKFKCKYCKSDVLKESDKIKLDEDSEIMLENEKIRKHNKEQEIFYELQEAELRIFGERLRKLADKKNSGIFSKHNYKLEIRDDYISIHTGKDWYAFSDEEAMYFIPTTRLYIAKTEKGKREAYIYISVNKKNLIEHRYMPCPLCNGKNYIPLVNSEYIIKL